MRARALIAAVGVVTLVLISAATLLGARSVDKPEDHTPQWQWLHGREAVADFARCQRCHDDRSCAACHFAEWPHESGWQAEHGAEAARLDGRGCYLCHRASYCDPCHGGVRMPHPAQFLVEHPRSQHPESSCRICHVDEECDRCHREHGAHRAGGLIVP